MVKPKWNRPKKSILTTYWNTLQPILPAEIYRPILCAIICVSDMYITVYLFTKLSSGVVSL